ncbi:MAG: exodeoxyribonuclease VII large subunit [Candidatus Methylumidiphilus sp.]
MLTKKPDTPRTIYTISELNSTARLLLSSHFGTIWVEGEISNLALPSSGHLYFTLKDDEAQVRCALFKGAARTLKFKPANGNKVLARAQVGLYEPRGEYQLVVDYMEEAGDGALRRAFELLKAKLAAEGLFDMARKKPIPLPPCCLGVITSPTGAALRDILSVLKRRFPALPVIVFPVKVQGVEAKHDIARAIALAVQQGDCGALILARGGGSLEDLWAFNEEIVARAIAACPLPIVSGVGHETDVTIADLVADWRAPTPTAAAEAVSPDGNAWLERFIRLETRLRQRLAESLRQSAQALAFLDKRLQQAHPEKHMRRQAQRLDELELRLRRAVLAGLAKHAGRLYSADVRLRSQHPAKRIDWLQARQTELDRRLRLSMDRLLQQQRHAVNTASGQLHTVSPLATLARGYAIASQLDGAILRRASEVEIGATVQIRLAEGVLLGEVAGKQDGA